MNQEISGTQDAVRPVPNMNIVKEPITDEKVEELVNEVTPDSFEKSIGRPGRVLSVSDWMFVHNKLSMVEHCGDHEFAAWLAQNVELIYSKIKTYLNVGLLSKVSQEAKLIMASDKSDKEKADEINAIRSKLKETTSAERNITVPVDVVRWSKEVPKELINIDVLRAFYRLNG